MSCSKAHVCLNNDLHVTHRRLVPNHIEMADLLRPYARDNASAVRPGPKVINRFSCSTQLSTKFILLIVGILTFISRINTPTKCLTARKIINFSILALIRS